MLPTQPILVTLDEYKALAFLFVIVGLLFTMKILFSMPMEREDEDEEF